MTSVGIIANPASGKDIRRLVAHGSVFNNHEKVNIVRRVLMGLDAIGVQTIVTMPDAFDICRKAQETLHLQARVEEMDMPVTSSSEDTTRAAARLRALGAGCLISLGGDGTNRALAKTCGEVPLLPLSTGTNNVFPYMMEGTLAGLAAGLVACGRVPLDEVLEQRPRLVVMVNDVATDIALVDAVLCDDPYIASRAVWDMNKVSLVVVARRLPAQIGFMALAGNLPPLPTMSADSGMVLEIAPQAPAVLAPIAPGLIVSVGVRQYRAFAIGESITLPAAPGTIALDGEREVVIRKGDRVRVVLEAQGPRVIQPQRVLALAAQQGCFLQEAP